MGRRHPSEQSPEQSNPLATTDSAGEVATTANSAAAAQEADGSLGGGTLEDYFCAKKTSGQVSQHLLSGSAEHNAMATENLSDPTCGELADKRGPDRALTAADDDQGDKKSGDEDQNDYEDDYEAETSSRKSAEEPNVAGMTLSEYLHVKDDESDAKAQEKVVSSAKRPGSLKKLPPQLAEKKKPAAPADVSGMSLDLYLGASPLASDEEKPRDASHDSRADKKASPKARRRGSKPKQLGPALPQTKTSQSPFSVKGSSLSQVLHPVSNSAPQHLSSDEEGSTGSNSHSSPSANLTPFQRRQKRKDRAKQRLQQQQRGSSVSKSILMAETSSSPSSSSLAMVLPYKDRDKRKAAAAGPHHGSHPSASHLQPPLPKLLSPSASVSSVGHKDQDSSNPSADDGGDSNEKLPPL